MADAPTGESKSDYPFVKTTTEPQGESKADTPFTNPVDAGAIARAASNAQSSGLMSVRSPDELANVASTEVNDDISGQIAPIQSQYDLLGTQEDRTRQNIQSMFGTIMPYVEHAAGAVKTGYDEAQTTEANIFAAAQQQLAQFKQSRAQEAQALAQQMGGPVAISEFTAGLGESQQALANLGAGQMLHTLGYAQADEANAQAFAGKVFPLIQTEEQAKARNFYEDQKKTLQDQITALKASIPAKITARTDELTATERQFGLDKGKLALDTRTAKANADIAEKTYQLQKTQAKLDKIKGDHDWQATLRTLKNDDARIKLAQQQYELSKGQVTGTVDGKPTVAQQQIDLQAKQLSQRDKEFAANLGLSNKEFVLRKQQLASNTKFAKQKIDLGVKMAAASYLDAALTPTFGKTVTTTTVAPTTREGALKDPKNSYTTTAKDGKTLLYWHYVKVSQTPQLTSAITNPNLLTDYLVAHNVPKKMAENMVRTRLGIPQWDYGEDPASDAAKKGLDIAIKKENARRKALGRLK